MFGFRVALSLRAGAWILKLIVVYVEKRRYPHNYTLKAMKFKTHAPARREETTNQTFTTAPRRCRRRRRTTRQMHSETD
jgi:hypothetical protein